MSAAGSAGVVVALHDLVAAETLVPDAANHLGRNVADLPPHGEPHIRSAGEGELHRLRIIGGGLRVNVGIEQLRPAEFWGDLRGWMLACFVAASPVFGEPGLQLGIDRADQPVQAVAHP